jgi:hypothetical protein
MASVIVSHSSLSRPATERLRAAGFARPCGYQGLSAQTSGAVLTPRPARRKNQLPVPPALAAAHEVERRAHSAQRIRVEHGISHLTNWRALSRHLGPTRPPRHHPARGRRTGLQPGTSPPI